jgi:hypothetical protein
MMRRTWLLSFAVLALAVAPSAWVWSNSRAVTMDSMSPSWSDKTAYCDMPYYPPCHL